MKALKILKESLTIKFDKAFGLDIGDRSIEIIELEKVFKFAISTYARTELPEGIVENGKILNQNVLAEKLKKLLKEAKPHKVSTNKVIVSLPESQIFTSCFEVDSKLKSSALTKEIADKISLSLPISLDKTYWDFVEKPLPDHLRKMIIFVSVPKDIANSYVKFCNSVGLEIVSLNIGSFSLARVVLKSSPNQSLIIDFGSGSTNLSFFDSNDKLNMTFTIPIAGYQMTQSIKSKLNIEEVEAETLKIKYGFKEGDKNTVRPIILPIIEDILKEIKKAIDYYEKTFNQKLEDIYLVGGSTFLPGLVEQMMSTLGKEVKVAKAVYNINFDLLTRKGGDFPLFANVLGLGMLGASNIFKDINLIKEMPSTEANSVNTLNLFNMGYLTKVNIVRTILNNKYVLATMVIILGVVLAILFQQAQNYFVNNIKLPKISTTNSEPITTSIQTSGSYQLIEDKDHGTYPATVEASKSYQKAKRISETGKLDLTTRAKLNG